MQGLRARFRCRLSNALRLYHRHWRRIDIDSLSKVPSLIGKFAAIGRPDGQLFFHICIDQYLFVRAVDVDDINIPGCLIATLCLKEYFPSIG